jgi:hypothetical protein
VNGLDRARDIVIDAHHPISPLLESWNETSPLMPKGKFVLNHRKNHFWTGVFEMNRLHRLASCINRLESSFSLGMERSMHFYGRKPFHPFEKLAGL